MGNQTINTILDNVPFFNVFSKKEKESLVALNNIFIKFSKGNLIINEGDHEEAVYIMLKGQVNITKKALPDVILSKLSAGSIFGEISLMQKRARGNNVTSIGEVVVMKLDKISIEKLPLTIQKKLHQSFIDILIKRLDEMNEKFIKASTHGKASK